MEITITIEDRIATAPADAVIICGNSGDTVAFDFDAEWSPYLIKTVRFAWLDTMTGQKRHIDKQYTGEPIEIPTIADAYEVGIGAYAGNLLSSTAARVPCERCTTDGATYHGGTTPDIYEELLEALGSLPSPEGGTPVFARRRLVSPQIAGEFVHVETEE